MHGSLCAYVRSGVKSDCKYSLVCLRFDVQTVCLTRKHAAVYDFFGQNTTGERREGRRKRSVYVGEREGGLIISAISKNRGLSNRKKAVLLKITAP